MKFMKKIQLVQKYTAVQSPRANFKPTPKYMYNFLRTVSYVLVRKRIR